jgi:glycosyltransferase involved in cell wall biosynthesis
MSSDKPDNKKEVFLFYPYKLGNVQGGTEPYYIGKHLADQYELRVFSQDDSLIFHSPTFSFPGSGLVSIFIVNTLLIPYWIYIGLHYRPDGVYSYRTIIVPPLLLKAILGTSVIYDLQCDPYEQPKEFGIANDSYLVKNIVKMSFYAHKYALEHCDVVVTPSEPLKDQITKRYNISDQKVLVVPLGVDTEKFTPQQKSNERVRLVYIGSIIRNRNVDIVAKAIRKLDVNKQLQVSLELFGSGNEEYIDEIKDIISETDAVFKWHGSVPHEEIPTSVGKCDVGLSPLPPLNSYEVSSPAKIFEYLSLGLPVIATDITAHSHILRAGKDCILVEPDNTSEFGDAITDILEENTRQIMSDNARNSALRHDWTKRFQQIESQIEKFG